MPLVDVPFDAAKDKPSTDPAETSLSATTTAMDDAVAKILEASRAATSREAL